MVDNHSHQNMIISEGEVFRFMPNQIYIVNEPSRYQNLLPDGSQREEKLIEFNQSNFGDTRMVSLKKRNGDQFEVLKMVWDQHTVDYRTQTKEIKDDVLTDQKVKVPETEPIPVYLIEDSEDDDVVFVKEYPVPNAKLQTCDSNTTDVDHEKKPRRNPSRKARNSKYRISSDDENIYEADFCMLDSTDDDSSQDDLVSESPPEEGKPQNLSVKDLKKWPVNGLHERPEFNAVTQKIEKFDYTIREIQNNAKKPRIEVAKRQKVYKKPAAKKYLPKKKTARKKTVKRDEVKVVKVSVNSVKDLVQENYKLLPDFMEIVIARRQNGVHECHSLVLGSKDADKSSERENSNENVEQENACVCLKNFKILLMNQSRLFSLVSGVSYAQARDGFKKIVNCNA